MDVSVSGKQIDLGESFRTYAVAEVTKVAVKYFAKAVESQVLVAKDAAGLRSDLSVHIGSNIIVQAHGIGNDAYAAFDTALTKLDKRLRKYKDRLRDHQKRDSGMVPENLAPYYIIESKEENEQVPENPLVIAETTRSIETLSVSEAVMRLDLGDLDALLFRNSAHGGLSMVYRRKDGNIGWVDPKDIKAA